MLFWGDVFCAGICQVKYCASHDVNYEPNLAEHSLKAVQ